MIEQRKKPGIYIPLIGGGGLSVAAIVWYLFRSQMDPVCAQIRDMEPRLAGVEKEQAVLAAKVLTRLDAIDSRLGAWERQNRWRIDGERIVETRRNE